MYVKDKIIKIFILITHDNNEFTYLTVKSQSMEAKTIHLFIYLFWQ